MFIDNTTIYDDPEICTLRDHLASKIIADDLLNQFYNKELDLLKNKKKPVIQEVQNPHNSKIPWTGTPTELVELLLGLNAKGTIGGGNLSIKEIEEICINSFDVYPGNIYQIIEQIKA